MDLEQTVTDFERDGFVKIPGMISPEELRALRSDTQIIIDLGYKSVAHPTDYRVKPDPETGEDVFHRVQFVFPLATTDPNPMIALLGHPAMLAVVRAILGDDLLCNVEALVFKLPGNGSEVLVHADCDPADTRSADEHIGFNIDFYLDDATPKTVVCWLPQAATSGTTPRRRSQLRGSTFPNCGRFS